MKLSMRNGLCSLCLCVLKIGSQCRKLRGDCMNHDIIYIQYACL